MSCLTCSCITGCYGIRMSRVNSIRKVTELYDRSSHYDRGRNPFLFLALTFRPTLGPSSLLSNGWRRLSPVVKQLKHKADISAHCRSSEYVKLYLHPRTSSGCGSLAQRQLCRLPCGKEKVFQLKRKPNME